MFVHASNVDMKILVIRANLTHFKKSVHHHNVQVHAYSHVYNVDIDITHISPAFFVGPITASGPQGSQHQAHRIKYIREVGKLDP